MKTRNSMVPVMLLAALMVAVFFHQAGAAGEDLPRAVFAAPSSQIYVKMAPDQAELSWVREDSGYRHPPVAVVLDGWFCDESIMQRTLITLKDLNAYTEALSKARDALANTFKVLLDVGKGSPPDRSAAQQVVSSAIEKALSATLYRNDSRLLELAEDITKRVLEDKFTIEGQKNEIYRSTVAWSGKVIPEQVGDDGYSATYVIQGCFQKADVEAVTKTLVNAAGALKSLA
jgi:hypothetical protein